MDRINAKRIKLDDLNQIFDLLEFKFKKLNSNIEAKKTYVNNLYNNDVNKIEVKFSIKNLADELNKQRGVLLKSLNNKLKAQVDEINENRHANTKLLETKVKAELFYLAKSSLSINDMFLLKYYFSNPFDNLFKFKKFYLNSKQINLPESLREIYEDFSTAKINKKIHLNLTLNRLFFYSFDENDNATMSIINKNGKVLYSKKLDNKHFSIIDQQTRANSTQIAILFRNSKDSIRRGEKTEVSYIEVYNLKLEKICKIDISQSYSSNFKFWNEYLIFEHETMPQLMIFNINTYRTTVSTFQYKNLSLRDKLLHVNENFFYFITSGLNYVCIISRGDGKILRSIAVKPRKLYEDTIQFDSQSQIYDIQNEDFKIVIDIYSATGDLLKKCTIIQLIDLYYFHKMKFSSYGTVVYRENDLVTETCIKYEEF